MATRRELWSFLCIIVKKKLTITKIWYFLYFKSKRIRKNRYNSFNNKNLEFNMAKNLTFLDIIIVIL